MILKDFKDFEGDFEQYCCYVEDERTKEIKYLDELDILPFLKKGTEISDLYAALHDAYNDEYDGDDMFWAIDEYELIAYIEKRFNTRFDADCFVKYYITGEVQKGTRYDSDTISDVSEVE